MFLSGRVIHALGNECLKLKDQHLATCEDHPLGLPASRLHVSPVSPWIFPVACTMLIQLSSVKQPAGKDPTIHMG